MGGSDLAIIHLIDGNVFISGILLEIMFYLSRDLRWAIESRPMRSGKKKRGIGKL